MKFIKVRNFIISFITAFIASVRPFFGPRGVCIYQISCQNYTKHTLTNKPLYLALPLIFFRVLSCNPITALILKYKKSRK